MGLSAVLQIGTTGMRVYQVATEVASENIANVNTPGYSRQRIVLESAEPTTHNGFPLGSGVNVATVERYYDALLQKQLINASTTSGYGSKKSEVLQQIEPIFNEVVQDGLGAAISDYFSSWQDLSLNPSGNAERQAVLNQGQALADQFHYAAGTVSDAITTQNESLQPLTDEMNSMLSDIARLNGQIKLTELVSGNANEMRDQRDYLVRQLSEKVAVSFTENSDGSTDVSYTDTTGTYSLVSGSSAGSFSLVNSGTTLPDGSARLSVQVTPAGGGAAATIAPTTGELGATITMRDTTLQGYLDQVDTLAFNMINQVNAVHSAGYGLDSTQNNFFTPAATSAGAAAGMALAFTDINKVAAAQGPLPIATGDNRNALALATLNHTNGYSSDYNKLVAQVGLDVQNAATVVKQDAAFMKQLTTLRDSNSGVSLDEELTDLMKYQRSYQACAKLITTAGDMLDIAVNLVR